MCRIAARPGDNILFVPATTRFVMRIVADMRGMKFRREVVCGLDLSRNFSGSTFGNDFYWFDEVW